MRKSIRRKIDRKIRGLTKKRRMLLMFRSKKKKMMMMMMMTWKLHHDGGDCYRMNFLECLNKDYLPEGSAYES